MAHLSAFHTCFGLHDDGVEMRKRVLARLSASTHLGFRLTLRTCLSANLVHAAGTLTATGLSAITQSSRLPHDLV
ncbi:hypothetical protein Cob_v002617 [Colletotrichum orbiculare MAFF 240422]|uniref:Uncharacterized protein n=1 Tax=Colletotrichum orbiculare (strain 104-T / ATCC 96160 / CBS 514.97 / LARS 414 / MAFF 240422) TaxID=1213857 RepID=A0A484G183_COLOR|nr:hypothetical protein Cob_v002617 [Colletotrichum orbiculare MAFF 240422]